MKQRGGAHLSSLSLNATLNRFMAALRSFNIPNCWKALRAFIDLFHENNAWISFIFLPSAGRPTCTCCCCCSCCWDIYLHLDIWHYNLDISDFAFTNFQFLENSWKIPEFLWKFLKFFEFFKKNWNVWIFWKFLNFLKSLKIFKFLNFWIFFWKILYFFWKFLKIWNFFHFYLIKNF